MRAEKVCYFHKLLQRFPTAGSLVFWSQNNSYSHYFFPGFSLTYPRCFHVRTTDKASVFSNRQQIVHNLFACERYVLWKYSRWENLFLSRSNIFNNAQKNGRHRCHAFFLCVVVNRRRLQSVHTRTFRPCHETPVEWGGCSHRGPLRWIVRFLVSRDGADEGLIRRFPTASSVSILKLLLIFDTIMAG